MEKQQEKIKKIKRQCVACGGINIEYLTKENNFKRKKFCKYCMAELFPLYVVLSSK